MRWAVLVTRVRQMRNAYTVLLGKPEQERPLETPGCRWDRNIVRVWLVFFWLRVFISGRLL
jgi:hypothetical protein